MPLALITGVTGQDGAYLAEHLLSRGYRVVGLAREGSDDWRLRERKIADQVSILPPPRKECSAWTELMGNLRPQEVYHLASLSSKTESYERPLVSGEGDALMTLWLLEALRVASPESRFFQASSAEIFGSGAPPPQCESTPLAPASPYACAKAYGMHLVSTYRQAYGLFACSGILFNHESPLRGPNFVTRKIAMEMARHRLGASPPLQLGNLDSKRDWGYAREYTQAMMAMVGAEVAQDFVVATGVAHSVREFCEFCAAACGFELGWEVEEEVERGRDRASGRVLVESRLEGHRPLDIAHFQGDPARIRQCLGWKAVTLAPQLAALMVEVELNRCQA